MIDEDFFTNPYPVYERMRAEVEPFQVHHQQGEYERDFVLFSRYADAKAIFAERHAISKDQGVIRPEGELPRLVDMHMLHKDGEDHQRLRKLVAGFFTPAAMAGMQAKVSQIVASTLDACGGREQVDLVADFAEPIPLRVIGEVMGVPEADLPKVRAWTLTLSGGFDSFLVAEQDPEQLKTCAEVFFGYLNGLLEEASRSRENSVMAQLASARSAGVISAGEALGSAMFLLVAGHETTVSLIGTGLWLLLTHPDQLALLREEPGLMDSAVEEILRLESPLQRTTFRVATQAFTVGDYRLEPGQQFGVIVGAANRDENAFADADRFLIARRANRHVAFGGGLHDCLGKHLARLEARMALGMILDRYPRLRLLSDKPQWRCNSFFRSLESLPASLG